MRKRSFYIWRKEYSVLVCKKSTLIQPITSPVEFIARALHFTNALPGFPATDLFLFVKLPLSHRHRIHSSMFFLDLESSFEIGLENRTDPRERELVCPKHLQAGYHFLNC